MRSRGRLVRLTVRFRRRAITEEVQPEPAASARSYGNVARQASIRFSGLAFDKLIGYVFLLFVAKTYGSTAQGLYLFGVGLFEIAFALTELGLERSVVRLVADLAARGKTAEVKGVMRTTLALTLPLAVAVALALAFFAPRLAGAVGRPELAPFLQLAAVVVPASLLADSHLWATEGLGYQRFTVLARMVVEPVVKVGVAVALFAPFGATTEAEPLAVAYACAIVTSAVIGTAVYRRFVLPRAAGVPVERHARDLLRVGLPVCGLNLLSRWLAWWDTFLIFTFLSATATTHYAAAYRTAMLPMMVSSAFDAAFRPRVAAALALGRGKELAREYTAVSRVVLTICLPAVVMLVAFSDRVMPVLGGQFAASGAVASIVAAGTLASYLVGPASSTLTMSGRSRLSLANAVAGGACGMLVGFSLVGRLGPAAAALGQLVSMVVWNALHAVAAWRTLGVVGVGRGHVRPLLAALVAAAAGAATNAVVPDAKYLAFVAVGTTVVVAYAGTLALVGLPAEDVALARGLVRLLRRER